MDVQSVIDHLRERDIELSLDRGALMISSPAGAVDVHVAFAIYKNQEEIIEYLREQADLT